MFKTLSLLLAFGSIALGAPVSTGARATVAKRGARSEPAAAPKARTMARASNTASPPTPDGVHTGPATWFTQDNLTGACGNYNLDATPLVALQYLLYGDTDSKSQYCGRYVNITNTANGKQVIAIVADACPTCEGAYALDLSLGAFDLVGNWDTGVLPISWSFLPSTYKPAFVTPTLTGPTVVKTTTRRTVRTSTLSAGTSKTPGAGLTTTKRTTTRTPSPGNLTTSTVKRSTSSRPAPTSTWVDARIRQNGITAFQATRRGTNKNAIVSWFNTKSTTDSTNGHSWCGFPYDNNTPGFAISLKQMMGNFGNNYEKAAKAFCGMEAEITSKSGKKLKLVVADAFDDRWVRTPNSIDMIINSFNTFNGARTTNKNVVQMDATWVFTGRRDLRYQFKGVGSGR
ncbi:BQ2448_4982 [Microbotryum intermedium]|uniref:BQ2448_4982 protein n=1 Tax=Microbotryum intermedium TaxID=269621 RepID=A0A238FM73_9BASI|nr:BQ2448_4982 [Microbotryum intermedium]